MLEEISADRQIQMASTSGKEDDDGKARHEGLVDDKGQCDAERHRTRKVASSMTTTGWRGGLGEYWSRWSSPLQLLREKLKMPAKPAAAGKCGSGVVAGVIDEGRSRMEKGKAAPRGSGLQFTVKGGDCGGAGVAAGGKEGDELQLVEKMKLRDIRLTTRQALEQLMKIMGRVVRLDTHFILSSAILAGVMILFTIEFGFYMMVKILINCFEGFSTPMRVRSLRRKMGSAKTWEEYKSVAERLDVLTGREAWKVRDELPQYDFRLMRKRVPQMKRARLSGNLRKLVIALRNSVDTTFFMTRAGVLEESLYSRTYVGTKYLVTSFVNEVMNGLSALQAVVNHHGTLRRHPQHAASSSSSSSSEKASQRSGGQAAGEQLAGIGSPSFDFSSSTDTPPLRRCSLTSAAAAEQQSLGDINSHQPPSSLHHHNIGGGARCVNTGPATPTGEGLGSREESPPRADEDVRGIGEWGTPSGGGTTTDTMIDKVASGLAKCRSATAAGSLIAAGRGSGGESDGEASSSAAGEVDGEALRIAVHQMRCQWGSTALVLSGGAALGWHHFGAIEPILKDKLLPKVICGTSAGASIASWLCTRSEEQCLAELEPHFLWSNLRAMEPQSWIARFSNFIQRGYGCDLTCWFKIANEFFGDMTFLDAYQKTGRILNITLTRADRVELPVILNVQNAPHVLIGSATIASASFPTLGPPFHLVERCVDTGAIIDSPTFEGEYFHDGSIIGDVPLAQLKEMWGVQFAIVSQVNPHVFPFCGLRVHGEAGRPVAWRGVSGRGKWRGGFILSGLEMVLKEHMRFLLRIVAVLDVSPTINGVNLGNLVQPYGGDITIHPRRFYWTHRNFLHDPTYDEALWYIQEGRSMMFAKYSLIYNRLLVDKTLDHLFRSVFQAVGHPTHTRRHNSLRGGGSHAAGGGDDVGGGSAVHRLLRVDSLPHQALSDISTPPTVRPASNEEGRTDTVDSATGRGVDDNDVGHVKTGDDAGDANGDLLH